MSDETLSRHASIGTHTSYKALPDESPSPGTTVQRVRSIFSIPPPLKRVFDRFPLVTYAENDTPIRAPAERHRHVLYVFTTEKDASAGNPSFNPSCLRYQTYLKLAGLDFKTSPSSNHASPSGSLPFLLPAIQGNHDDTKIQQPVIATRLKKWIGGRDDVWLVEETDNTRHDTYASLVDERVRKAWLYQLYLNPANRSIVTRLYVERCSASAFVQLTVHQQLRSAAIAQLSTITSIIAERDVYDDAEEAFSALSIVLGDDDFFFGQQKPSMFDANVFSYTYLLLKEDLLEWNDNKLGELLARHHNLVKHQERIANLYY